MRKHFTKEVGLVLILLMMLVVAACGKKVTLEDWVNSSSDFQDMVDDMKKEMGSDATVDVYAEGNVLYIKLYYNETFDLSNVMVKSMIVQLFDNTMEANKEALLADLSDLQDKTKLEEVSVQYEFYNGDNSLIYSKLLTVD